MWHYILSTAQIFRVVLICFWMYIALSFFISLFWPLLPTHCRCRKLLLPPITLSGKQKWSVVLFGRGIGSSQRSIPGKTQNTHVQTSMLSARFEAAIPTSERPQTFVFDSSDTAIGHCTVSTRYCHKFPSLLSASCQVLSPFFFFLHPMHNLTLTEVNYICCHIGLARDCLLERSIETCLFSWFNARGIPFFSQNANSSL
jgi:hypothetical protein